MRVKQKYIDILGQALWDAYPKDYPPDPNRDILLGRILWARYLSPQAKFRAGKEWNWHFGWLHLVGRDRRNQKELKRLYDAGVREYQGYKIYGGNSEPYLERWTKECVNDVWQHIDSLPEDVLGKLLGVMK